MSREDGRRKATRQEALLSVTIHDKDQQLGLPVFTAEDKSKAPSLCASEEASGFYRRGKIGSPFTLSDRNGFQTFKGPLCYIAPVQDPVLVWQPTDAMP